MFEVYFSVAIATDYLQINALLKILKDISSTTKNIQEKWTSVKNGNFVYLCSHVLAII